MNVFLLNITNDEQQRVTAVRGIGHETDPQRGPWFYYVCDVRKHYQFQGPRHIERNVKLSAAELHQAATTRNGKEHFERLHIALSLYLIENGTERDEEFPLVAPDGTKYWWVPFKRKGFQKL